MPSIRIRPATQTDIPLLISFQQSLARETESVDLDPSILQQGMIRMFEDPTRGAYYVAEVDGDIAGCHMLTYEWSDWRNGTVYWLQSVYVKAEYRKHGVFKAMFDKLMNTINTDPDIKGLRLYVDKSNGRAMQVYAAMGMNGDHYTVFELMK